MTVLLLGLMVALLALVVILAALAPESTWAKLRRDRPAPDAFCCKSRLAADTRWPRRKGRAVWVHDVLIVSTGRIRPRVTALPVRLPEEVIREARPTEISGLGLHPVVITLRLDDRQLVDVATAEQDRSLLVGPFCAAAIPGLRPGRAERLLQKPLGPSRRSDPKKRD